MSKKGKISILLSVVLVSALITAISPKNGQDPAFHHFVDTRGWLGIKNFGNVLSNLPFLAVGIWGFIVLGKRRPVDGIWAIYAVMFFGIFLTGIGSAYYHWAPSNDRLIWDRMPQTIVFMSALVATVGEWINPKAAAGVLAPLVILGIGSVLWWNHTEALGAGDLRLYWWVQFFPMVGIPLILLLFGRWDNMQGLGNLIWVVVWYGVAKGLEALDAKIYDWIIVISGHTLKHFAAAISAAYLVLLFKTRHAIEKQSPGLANSTAGSRNEHKSTSLTVPK
ncbi:MAG TPA: hypothetical protein VL547_14650 [Dinghuibacter sp.]|uniref:hypothetical protein n=1 Tax=Dinghuibacter sp. TaxID=2024697 RepID=UPI002C8E0953|nr:hypothetical protein [Dinghuibacter sp.]HTJ13272.1 hypothetical protein [Dinghuibacter sp.]